MNTRLTKRDIEFLRWIGKLRYLSTSLIAEFFFNGNLRVCRRRLKRLCEAGFLSWFYRPDSYRGGLEHVFVLNKKRREEIRHVLGEGMSFYCPPKNLLLVNHDLEVSRFILCLHGCCISNNQYSFEFFTANEGQSKDSMPFIGKNKKVLVPDCTIKLNGSIGSTLLLGEIDMGSESINAVSSKKTDIRKKLNSYVSYWNCEGYKKLSKKFRYSFKGFRLLLVTPPSRIKSIGELCCELDCGFVWLTSFDKMNDLFNKVWLVPCSDKKELRALVKS